MKNGTRYNVVLPPPVEEELEDLTKALNTTKADVLRRSITLLKHAVEADRVALYTKREDGGENTLEVLLK